ncbi:hypothetical protein CEUSTIGMA_g3166.t1 [Chlamydomonas eustigma]|uniref:Reverse transcriptase Ty1/copia-type domain-containing protein n=1 Tax=Chlamydomonas eustigma TaxID=1157962 RepID=A0A250WY06_9CHLO|nr:hypothetical protein CEUSTIGMA_g3166.t1 [Chlamydomonas eustigma]|eukprot:GAX75723.1 hypothetical protein CEUSTIGMA_g3166.t1 [Chlamydomonas eustigma]
MVVVVVTWVDDIVIASKQLHLVEEVEHGLEKVEKDMQIKKQGNLKHLKHHMGMEIQRQGNKILLSQKTYIHNVLYRFGKKSCKGQKVPLNSKVKVTRETGVTGEKLDKDGIRPRVAWTKDMGLEFGGRKPNFIVYSDSDFGGETDEKRSTTGFVCILSGGEVDWNNRLQQTMAVSTCEEEYQAAGAVVRAGLWWRKLLPKLGIETGVVDIRGDNQSTLATVISNPISSDKTKHIIISPGRGWRWGRLDSATAAQRRWWLISSQKL